MTIENSKTGFKYYLVKSISCLVVSVLPNPFKIFYIDSKRPHPKSTHIEDLLSLLYLLVLSALLLHLDYIL